MTLHIACSRFLTAGILLTVCLAQSDHAKAASADDPLLLMGVLDQFEWRDTVGDSTLSWEGQGWVGKDLRNLWFKT